MTLEGDRIRRLAHQHLLRKEMRHRPDGGAVAQPVADRDRLRIARQWDHVFVVENPPLVEDRPADLAQYNAVPLRFKALVAHDILHRLEIDPAHAAPLPRMAQDVTDLAVVYPFAHGGDEGCGEPNLFQVGEGHRMGAPQIGASYGLQSRAAQ